MTIVVAAIVLMLIVVGPLFGEVPSSPSGSVSMGGSPCCGHGSAGRLSSSR